MKASIYDFNRMGAWYAPHSFFYFSAYIEFGVYETGVKNLIEAEKIASENFSMEEEYKSSLILHETAELHKPCMRAACSSLMFGCMAFEGFMNYYGVKRLGEKYYKRFVERMGISEKLAYLVSLGKDSVLLIEDDGLSKCRRLFDARNQLAHPKSGEVFDSNGKLKSIPIDHPSLFPIRQHLQDLEACIDLFCEHDPDINRSFEFKRP
jgi:hypothetical protein